MKAIVLGGTKGIGKAIAESLENTGYTVVATGRQQVDTADMDSVRQFATTQKSTDILVLNTGGPPPKTLNDVADHEWDRYHDQLFKGLVILLREIKVNPGGYIFLISSSVVKEPNPVLVLSSAYRAAFVEVLKIYSKVAAASNISCIDIAPGLIATDRAKEVVKDMGVNVSQLPMGRMGEPREIGDFVATIVQKNIKYLSGITITFDGASSAHLF